jgi:hypothetical protein
MLREHGRLERRRVFDVFFNMVHSGSAPTSEPTGAQD